MVAIKPNQKTPKKKGEDVAAEGRESEILKGTTTTRNKPSKV